MRKLQIQEFALSTSVEYRLPILLNEANLAEKARALVASSCGPFLNPAEIALSKQNELFSYSLSVPLFNDSASLILNALGATISFKQGRTREHLDLMVKTSVAALEIAKAAEVKRSALAFTAHAVFDSQEEYLEHMKRFTSLGGGITSGGLVLVAAMPEIEGELRLVFEKSLLYENALFLASNAFCARNADASLYDVLAARLEAMAALGQLSFKMN